MSPTDMQDHRLDPTVDAEMFPPRDPLVRVVLYLVGLLLCYLLYGAAAVTLSMRLRGDEAPTVGGARMSVVEVAVVGMILFLPLMALLTAQFARSYDRRGLRELGWFLPGRAAWQATVTTVATLIVMAVWIVLTWFAADLSFGGVATAFRAVASSWGPLGAVGLTLLIAAGFLCQSACEELAFRGYVYRALKDRFTRPAAAAMSAALFSLGHGLNPMQNPFGVLNTFLIGLGLAVVVELAGGVWAATVAHATWNFALACVLSMPVSGFRMFHLFEVELAGARVVTGGSYGPEASGLLTLVLVVALGVALYALSRSRFRSAPGRRPP